jgi:hypothetical protein
MKTSRRDLLLGAAALTAVQAAAQDLNPPQGKTMIGVPFEGRSTIRMGLIGAGGRGSSMLGEFLACENVRITAICDINEDHAKKAAAAVTKRGYPDPALYTDGDHAYEKLVERDDIDFVYCPVPWPVHTPAAIAAMEHGKHALVEVPAGLTIDDCWNLVNTSERTRKHCIMCENCCYGYNELMILNMVRAGMLGDLYHGEGAYLHDLRTVLHDNGEGTWRRKPHTERNGNFYPTHGLGPVANYMDIQRGDRFEYMVSMSSAHFGLEQYREAHVPKDSPEWQEKYICGDMNTSLIRTAMGRTIVLKHDVVNPRPYSRINMIAGSKGLFEDYPPRIYIDGSPKEAYTSLDPWKDKFEHAFWREQGETARKLGSHGGMDFVMAYRLTEAMRKGLVPDMDVYDAVAWSAPGPLSETSVAKGSARMDFPDFTRGLWKNKRPTMV